MKNIYVTRPYLPPLEEFLPYLENIWESKWLTNNGPYHQELEKKMAEYLGVKHLALFANGTLALLTALQALEITGEVITTPFTFVATAHALLWNGIKPVFVDMRSKTFNLDPEEIEAAITPQTTAILPVHVYGHPCDVERIREIADAHGFKIIYDAAHAFGVTYKGQSLLTHGDLSILSFHATKVFNTFEGGAIICHDEETKKRIDDLKNFGYAGELNVVGTGINAKMNELQAAFGLVQLKHVDKAIALRREVDAHYREQLSSVQGVTCPSLPLDTCYNYSYFPIVIEEDYPLSCEGLNDALRNQGIFPRRYFYPLISEFPMYKDLPSAAHTNLPVARKVAERVLCLPIYPGLDSASIETITSIIRDV
ncbi:MAG: DegT/DnrJ/EryC1/StrS family aminotransferase [Nitrospirae bacterium]|nr:DegT/DnrJ/EryC1/StrS family aminotransferase [Nitrospirota bacterium]